MRQPMRVEGTVVAAATLRPVVGATVRIIGHSKQLADVPSATNLPNDGIAWTRCLTGFGGSRWELWDQQIKHVPGITWSQFASDALAYNPQLNADGRLFHADKSYLVPENVATGRVALSTQTQSDGSFVFTSIPGPDSYVLELIAPGYTRWLGPLLVNQPFIVPIQLTGTSLTRSLLPDYATLPSVARTVIDQALAMLGDDTAVFDTLPPQLRSLAYGAQFVDQPNHLHHKDIVCADLVSICFAAASLPISWTVTAPPGEFDSPHKANHYRPGAVPQLIEITDNQDWLPGDVLCYGRGPFATTKLGHVNLYIGPFAGVDKSGLAYAPAQNCEVVEASLDGQDGNTRTGLGVIGCTRENCLTRKRGWEWVRRVRLRALAEAFGR